MPSSSSARSSRHFGACSCAWLELAHIFCCAHIREPSEPSGKMARLARALASHITAMQPPPPMRKQPPLEAHSLRGLCFAGPCWGARSPVWFPGVPSLLHNLASPSSSPSLPFPLPLPTPLPPSGGATATRLPPLGDPPLTKTQHKEAPGLFEARFECLGGILALLIAHFRLG